MENVLLALTHVHILFYAYHLVFFAPVMTLCEQLMLSFCYFAPVFCKKYRFTIWSHYSMTLEF